MVISSDDLPAIKNWKKGKKYKITLVAQQVSETKDGEASFDIENARGELANTEGRSSFKKTFDSTLENLQENKNG